MKLLKRDFIPSYVKSICERPLPSGKAYYIEINNETKYASPEYTRKHFSKKEIANIPDLTKGLIATFEKENDFIPFNENGGFISQKDIDKYNAILYIIYREEKMHNFSMGEKNFTLKDFYYYYQERENLLDHQVKMILDIENEEKSKRKSLKNLATCYAYEFKIKRALEVLNQREEDDSELQQLLQSLYENLKLTKSQIKTVKGFFKGLTDDLKDSKLQEFDTKY